MPERLILRRFREIADEVRSIPDGRYGTYRRSGSCRTSSRARSTMQIIVTTTTTHKTLRGPRGGMILFHEEFADKEHQLQ